MRLNICAIISRIKKYKSIIKKKKKKHVEIALFFNQLIYWVQLIYFNGCVNKKYDYLNEEINKPETS